MAGMTIPFGPQHPVLPEPIHLNLKVEDEVVTAATPAFGYIHRGLEKLVDRKDFHQMVQVVERVCGICSMMHALIYCQGIEQLMGIEPPPRARFLRVIWSELHRMHSHLLWLGLFADAMGFESLFMQIWKIRERIMDINEATAGNRVIVPVNIVGGLRRDLDSEQIRWMLDELAAVEKELQDIKPVIFNDYTVQQRTCGKGVLSGEQAMELGCAGPMLRGSGIEQDTRMEGYAAYGELDFAPLTEKDGDCQARFRVRFRELGQSIDLIRQAIHALPGGEISSPCKGRPEGEIVSRAEQPRGECLYYIKANGSKFLDRLRIRTPTFANIPTLTVMLPGMELADVPVVLLSIDPCISCTER